MGNQNASYYTCRRAQYYDDDETTLLFLYRILRMLRILPAKYFDKFLVQPIRVHAYGRHDPVVLFIGLVRNARIFMKNII
jgi:hypothetical protein